MSQQDGTIPYNTSVGVLLKAIPPFIIMTERVCQLGSCISLNIQNRARLSCFSQKIKPTSIIIISSIVGTIMFTLL